MKITIEKVSTGAVAGDFTGDGLRTGMEKVNRNFERVATAYEEISQVVEHSEQWAGVRLNPKLGGTEMTRVGTVDFNRIFEDVSCVALSDSGVETTLATYYSPKINNIPSGQQIMTKIPRKYYREIINEDGEWCGFDISNLPLAGFKLHEKFSWGNGRDSIYVGSFEASEVDGKMASVPAFDIRASLTVRQFNDMAKLRGAGYHGYDFYTNHLLQMLFYLYYANMNSQLVLPAYSEHTWADSAIRKTGRTINLTTVNGYVNADETGVDADLAGGWFGTSRVIANRFLWIENFYGHVWKFLDGITFDGRIGQKNTAFATPNPNLFSSTDSEIIANYTNLGIDLPANVNEGWQSTLGVLMLPNAFGRDSATGVTDYFWSYLDDETRNYLRVVIAGGALAHAADGGVAARDSAYVLGSAWTHIGSHLCYEKN